MKNLLIVGNWKENKDQKEALDFLVEFSKIFQPRQNVKVIICPPYLVIPAASEFVKSNNLEVNLGVQNISKFDEGAHTGEISAREASEFVGYSIIGHSERRAQGETDEDVQQKVGMAVKNGIEPILCVINENIPVPHQTRIVAYEPVEAIGTGNPDTPDNAQRIASLIKSKHSNVQEVLYGGSVTSQNVKSFTEMEDISGVLVGGASLDAAEFSSIIKQC